MSGTLRLTVDTDATPATTAIREAAHAAPTLLVLTDRVLTDVAAELGGTDAAVRFLVDLAGEIGRPLGVNVETAADTSSTAFIAPRGWSQERLSGWVAAKHEELVAEFGEAVRIGAEPGGAG